jgi:hypothetical protein
MNTPLWHFDYSSILPLVGTLETLSLGDLDIDKGLPEIFDTLSNAPEKRLRSLTLTLRKYASLSLMNEVAPKVLVMLRELDLRLELPYGDMVNGRQSA